ncbi:epoxide hydrolase family protein [Streptomyces sp. FH025]|uniref:epoxide hydrolase family protein n=1 Tax=Streptomyces sp. FH025 TaxID=2815937 RepID=UPI001A9EE880|nr:epoxide hydrolase family protein [Streptomyces sp. FH025]MBO1416065.1 epoxide hydrolase [Streptomyces sp. FH025]
MDTAPFPLSPTPIHVPDEVLDDLRDRLARTRLPLGEPDDPSYGVPRARLADLLTYWRDGYDWRRAEAAINAYENYTVTVDGTPVHFLRRAGVGPRPVPLILSHGWPWTFWHWSKVIDPLADPGAHGGDPADAFDVIVPSLPGFGFPGPLTGHPDLTFVQVADLWHSLMTRTLGYGRYAAGGCDIGALVCGQLGHKYAGALYGIHIGSGQRLDFLSGDRAWSITQGRPLPDDLPDGIRERALALERRFAVHLTTHMLEPATLAAGLSDSPAGLLAWLLARWDGWSEHDGDVEKVFSRDDLLTHATVYWANNAIGSSIRYYANIDRHPWRPSHDRWPVVEAPTGITFVGYENPPGVSTDRRVQSFLDSDRAAWYNHVNLTAHERGGHFIPWENPGAWVDDLRRTFRSRRP